MTRPLILLTGGAAQTGSGVPVCGVPETYARAVRRAGGLPALAVDDEAGSYAARFDGLLLTGGVDADPAMYGETPLNAAVEIDGVRDKRERALFDAFRAAGKPIFGICRGIQMLAVFLGGTLWQDLPAQRGLHHAGGVIHTVRVRPGHRLADGLESSFPVNSFHHQSIRTLPPGFSATAHAEDGVIEAAACDSEPIWGVQWHPERMTGADGSLPDQGALFERFVTQCRMR